MFKFFLDIKTRDETNKQINSECISIYKKKIDLYNTILERMNINYNKSNCLYEHKQILLNPDNLKKNDYNIKYQLVEDLTMAGELGELNAYIPNFISYLWKEPKIVYKLLLNANSKDMKESLSNFICNNFYENILSPNYIEHNLLYLITLLLNDEINNISKKKIEDPSKCLDFFLKDSSCSFILEQFHKKNDVQIFFKTILLNIIENLELSSSNKEMIFDYHILEERFINKNKNKKININIKKEDRRNPSSNLSVSYSSLSSLSDALDYESYEKNITSINSEFFKNELSNYKSNEKMIGYLLYYMDENDPVKDKYSPEFFIKKNLNDDVITREVLDEYILNYDKTINLINQLFKNLLDYLYLLPYSIKCICKIIFSLIQKKFQRFNIFHQYAFMSKFFFEKLLTPIFQNPGLGALINTFIISTTTVKNLELISKVINTFTLGKLYTRNKEEESYTPFNNYFISKMPDLITFYEEITKVELPSFIENFINAKLPEDFEYNYFKENPEEEIYHKSTIFTIEDLSLLIELMDKSKKSIFPNNNKNEELIKLQKTFEKLSSRKSKDLIKKLKIKVEHEIIDVPVYNKKKKTIKEYRKENGRKIIKYYLISELSLNDKYSKIFNIEQKTKYFNLPELQDMKNDEDNMLNNIIKVKNFFCTILYNYRMLVKTDFEEDKIDSTIDILTELKRFMKSSNNIIDGNFPSQWFVNSLLDYLNIIPKNLVEDNCEALIIEIQKEVNKAIKNLNFEDLSVLIDRIKFATRGKIYFENAQNLIIDINLNKKAQSIVENEIIEVEILIKFNEKEKELIIEPPKKNEKHLNYLDNIFDEPKKKPSKICNTIKLFTKNFPDLIKYQKFYKTNILNIEKELKVPQKLNNYFKMIKEYIRNNMNITDEKEFLNINNKIDDYIMEKLYDKLFPKDLNETDGKIIEKCEKLSWVEPKHFINGNNNYVYDSFLPDLTNYLMLVTKEKSVRKKLINAKLIFQCMNNLGQFNGEGAFGIDDQMKILNYAFIKAKPSHMFANCEYLKLFIGNKDGGIEGQNLAELEAICQHVIDLNAEDLNGIDEKEFIDNCCKSLSRISSHYDLEMVI